VVKELLVILDGASEPLGAARTSLERAHTPVLNRLARSGDLRRVKTVPDGLPAGSETAIPVLLGWVPHEPVDRALVEAAARDIAVPPGQRAWRVDVRCAAGGARGAGRADARATAAAASELEASHRVHLIGGHRLLVVGRAPLPELPANLHVWPIGSPLPAILTRDTTVIAARGAAAGIAKLLGARVVVPDGATGDVATDLAAKADAALSALGSGASRIVVHVAGADEAAHERDRDAKVAFLERADSELIEPLARAGVTLTICADHGCDPATGEHDGDPVPSLTWPGHGGARRFTERDAAAAYAIDLTAGFVHA
jgi:2,3-bisphosphoglycerate-independent phosphoglycerate mutase